MTILKWIANSVLVIGLFMFAYGFLSDPGIPYQDPTPELAKRYYEEQYLASAIMNRAAIVLLVGVVLKVVQWVLRFVKPSAKQ